MVRLQPTPEENEAEDLAIWLCRNPEAVAALDRRLNPDKGGQTVTSPEPHADGQAEAEADPQAEAGL
jgi:hypothetical protein